MQRAKGIASRIYYAPLRGYQALARQVQKQIIDPVRNLGEIAAQNLVLATPGNPVLKASDLNLYMTKGEGDSRIHDEYDPIVTSPHLTKKADGTMEEYSFVRKFAEGGMATIYEVRDSKERMRLAKWIKIPEGLNEANIAHLLMRFDREIEVTSKIDHRNVVEVIARDARTNPRFFVMDFITGGDLFSLVTVPGKLGSYLKGKDRFTPTQAAIIIAQTLNGLLAFERTVRDDKATGIKDRKRGIAHRDLKAENLLVDFEMRQVEKTGAWKLFLTVKVSDFGIVKKPESDATAMGTYFGSPPPWVAPELLPDRSVYANQCSDNYALGEILYFILAGREAFEKELAAYHDPWMRMAVFNASAKEWLEARRKQAPPRPDIPPRLWDLTMRATAFDPAERPQTYLEFRRALDEFLPEKKK